jgi:hypothetical protein
LTYSEVLSSVANNSPQNTSTLVFSGVNTTIEEKLEQKEEYKQKIIHPELRAKIVDIS